jgi:4-hydroxyphenylpyruvate dioxygenase-like putative hemolysin
MQQQIDHVSHVCFIYKKENLAAAKKQFGDAFGISDWDGPAELPYFGILQTQSVSAGIEIIAPLGDDTEFAGYLRVHGEGFFALIFGVRDLDKAVKQAREKGAEPHLTAAGEPVLIDAMRIDGGRPAYASWSERLKAYREVPLKPICGVNFYLGQIEPLQHS